MPVTAIKVKKDIKVIITTIKEVMENTEKKAVRVNTAKRVGTRRDSTTRAIITANITKRVEVTKAVNTARRKDIKRDKKQPVTIINRIKMIIIRSINSTMIITKEDIIPNMETSADITDRKKVDTRREGATRADTMVIVSARRDTMIKVTTKIPIKDIKEVTVVKVIMPIMRIMERKVVATVVKSMDSAAVMEAAAVADTVVDMAVDIIELITKPAIIVCLMFLLNDLKNVELIKFV